MAESLARAEIQKFLERLGQKYTQPLKVYLLGGSALCFFGSPRRTLDIDCTVESPSEDFEATAKKVADEMTLEVEIIPIKEFIPLPAQSATRHHRVGQFGRLEVYIFDPYSIALSKLARGFDTDIQDILFLLEHGIIEIETLSRFAEDTISLAWDYDIDPVEMKKYLETVKTRYHQE